MLLLLEVYNAYLNICERLQQRLRKGLFTLLHEDGGHVAVSFLSK